MAVGDNQPRVRSRSFAGTAPGKVILFGEHAVVYGQPAIAVPVTDVQARATVTPLTGTDGIWLFAADLPGFTDDSMGRRYRLDDAESDDPLRVAVELAVAAFGGDTERWHDGTEPGLLITINSTIPIARGLGSGAAVATAVVRAIAGHLGQSPPPEEVSRLVYEVEKLHHGTPSGIDNTVVAYERPVYFVRGEGMTRLRAGSPFGLIIADTGKASSTRRVVGHVRNRWKADPDRYQRLFDQIGDVARQARTAIEEGDRHAIGRLMAQNHHLLVALGVSSPDLDRLVGVALEAGATGAKMSGAGWGGHILALAEPHATPDVTDALGDAGAAHIISTTVV